jgi:DNA-binding transcriptional MocR family regulator
VSIQALSWVLEESESEGLDRLVLLVVANHANDEWRAWPSVRTIAREARVSTNTVGKAIRRLVALGELELERQGDRRRSSTYRMTRAPGTPVLSGVADPRHPSEGECREGVAQVSRLGRDTGVAQVSRLGRDRTKNQEPRTAQQSHSLERFPAEPELERDELAARARDVLSALRIRRMVGPTEQESEEQSA